MQGWLFVHSLFFWTREKAKALITSVPKVSNFYYFCFRTMQGWLFHSSDYWLDIERVQSFITSVPLVCLSLFSNGDGGGFI